MTSSGNIDRGWLLRPAVSSGPVLRAVIGAGRYSTPEGNQLHEFLHIPVRDLVGSFRSSSCVPCLYTFESTICFYPFQYQIQSCESIRFLEFASDEATTDLVDLVDTSQRVVEFGLVPVPDQVREFVRELNQGCDLSEEDEVLYSELTMCCSEVGPDISAYVDVFSQVFGLETFLPQRPDTPACTLCRRPMRLLAAIAGNARIGTTYVPDSGQVVFHICFSCCVINCAHFA